jgi:hypothetical protein
MTERPEDVYCGLILIQGTLQRLIAPKMPFADKCYRSTLGSSACLVTSLGCVGSLMRAGWRVFSCRRWNSANALFCSTVLVKIP